MFHAKVLGIEFRGSSALPLIVCYKNIAGISVSSSQSKLVKVGLIMHDITQHLTTSTKSRTLSKS